VAGRQARRSRPQPRATEPQPSPALACAGREMATRGTNTAPNARTRRSGAARPAPPPHRPTLPRPQRRRLPTPTAAVDASHRTQPCRSLHTLLHGRWSAGSARARPHTRSQADRAHQGRDNQEIPAPPIGIHPEGGQPGREPPPAHEKPYEGGACETTKRAEGRGGPGLPWPALGPLDQRQLSPLSTAGPTNCRATSRASRWFAHGTNR